jgi:hypothetical protein
MRGIVLSLCDRTGAMIQPWIDAGYRAVTVDLQPAANPHPSREHVIADVTKWRPPLRMGRPVFVSAFPPCTDLAVSGTRWWKEKGLCALASALLVVDACREICEAAGAPWVLENPVGVLSSRWREPDYSFDPCDYGNPYNKRTCLWTGGGFVMPPIVRVPDLFEERTSVEPTMKNHIYHMSPSADRGDKRSVTPAGFALAVYTANAPHLRGNNPGADKQEQKMADQNGWINAAIHTARAGRSPLTLAVNIDIAENVLAEAMRRGEYQLAAEYQKMVDTLRADFR